MKKLSIAVLVIVALAAGCVKTKDTAESWEVWAESVREYDEKMMQIDSELERPSKALESAIKEKDTDKITKAMSELMDTSNAAVQKMEKLKPLDELLTFHNKKIESMKELNLAQKAIFNEDIDTYRQHKEKSDLAEIEAYKSLREVYISHNCPPEVMAKFDESFEEIKKILE